MDEPMRRSDLVAAVEKEDTSTNAPSLEVRLLWVCSSKGNERPGEILRFSKAERGPGFYDFLSAPEGPYCVFLKKSSLEFGTYRFGEIKHEFFPLDKGIKRRRLSGADGVKADLIAGVTSQEDRIAEASVDWIIRLRIGDGDAVIRKLAQKENAPVWVQAYVLHKDLPNGKTVDV